MTGFFRATDPKKLWKRYSVALLLLLTMMIGGHALHIKIINSGINDAETIDLSGRQRMLSQRISNLALLLSENREQALVSASLGNAVREFETAHQTLIRRASNIPEASKLYAVGTENGLDHRSKQFIADVHRFISSKGAAADASASLLRIQNAAFSSLLTELDDAVKAFAGDAKSRHKVLQNYQTLALCIAIFLLLAESALIFWPAHKSVIASLRTASEREDQLKEHNDKLQTLSEQLEHAANHDHLTGLANRKKLSTELKQRLKERKTNHKHLCIMHIDLDGFKEVNDSLGHPVGDLVIRKTAQTMQERVRKSDLVARVGGDEFVILLSIDDNHPVEAAHRIADSIIERIKQPITINGNTCSVGASIGFIFASGANDNGEELIANADIALYSAKNAGKGKAIYFQEKMRRKIEYRHHLKQELCHAVEDREFVPFFQPKINLKDGNVSGLEALVRWQHPERGILPPEEFLSLAKETTVIKDLDQQVITKGLDAFIKLRGEGWDIPSISINVSEATLKSPSFVFDLCSTVERRGLITSDVTIEVLETTLVSEERNLALASLRSLMEQGFKIEIDDFGTSHASLSTLVDLDLSGLKIDQSLIQKLQDPKSKMVVETIIRLSHEMGLDVTAEGVETTAQFELLFSNSCDFAQGFGIAAPMSLEDTRNWLMQNGNHTVSAAV